MALATALLSFQHPSIAVPRAAGVLSVWLLVGVGGGLPLGPLGVVAWSRRLWNTPRRTQFLLVALAIALVTPILAYWRLLG